MSSPLMLTVTLDVTAMFFVFGKLPSVRALDLAS